jgi:hypothetical protein
MGLFGKLKQMFGIGGVKVRCTPGSPNLSNDGGALAATVELTSRSDQLVARLLVKIVEERSTGKGDEKKTQHFDLGSTVVATDVAVKTDQPQVLPFTGRSESGQVRLKRSRGPNR